MQNWKKFFSPDEISQLEKIAGNDLDSAMNYIAGYNPDKWCIDMPDIVDHDGVRYRIDADDRPGLLDYFSAKGVSDDGQIVYFRQFYLLTDEMEAEGQQAICVAWTAEE